MKNDQIGITIEIHICDEHAPRGPVSTRDAGLVGDVTVGSITIVVQQDVRTFGVDRKDIEITIMVEVGDGTIDRVAVGNGDARVPHP